MFKINCLEITVNKKHWKKKALQSTYQSIYKNILSDNDFTNPDEKVPVNKRFYFNNSFIVENEQQKDNPDAQPLYDDFFGKNINVQAIVGENGAGKSSLMDLIYMAINNLSFMFERGKNRPGAEPLYYIPNLYVNLYFSHMYDARNTELLSLQCKGDNVWLCFENNKAKNYYFNLYQYGDNVESFDNNEIAELTKNFFYTIVSNYSLQSFIPSNYKRQVFYFDDSTHEVSKNKVEASWINSIFHKNDSYIRSIVLNPFRGYGRINLDNEIELSKDRLTALLIWFAQEKESRYKNTLTPFHPYEYESLSFSYKEGFIREKIRNHFKTDEELILFDKIITDDFKIEAFVTGLLINNNSFLSIFLNEFFIKINNFSFIQKMACAYIIAKILSIVNKYPSYLGYRNIFSFAISEQHGLTLVNNQQKLFLELFDVLRKDTSHITKKLRRAINFLRTTITLTKDISGEDYFSSLFQWYSTNYHNEYAFHLYDKYTEWFKNLPPFNLNNHSKPFLFSYPAKIDESLPPSFFSYELYVNNLETKQKNIPYKQLSSGEVQMLQTLSIHAYHMDNLFSIYELDEIRPKYNHVNLVFDEVEICFHPEYQRKFVKKLIDMLQSLNFNDYFINIIIITHSPFILSDFPISNILFMKKGSQDESINKKALSFAQNIGKMMYDSFFMEKTIGDFAESKLKELIKYKQGKESKINDEDEAKQILNLIGDPIIRSLIEEVEKIEVSDD